MNGKPLEYYLGLNYDVVLRKIEGYEEPMYRATIKELDPGTFYGTGDTPEEAIAHLNEVKNELFPYYLERGLDIPEPEREDDDLPSGKFVVRIPPALHMRLLRQAKRNGQSLNSLVSAIFERYSTTEELLAVAKKEFMECTERFGLDIKWAYSWSTCPSAPSADQHQQGQLRKVA